MLTPPIRALSVEAQAALDDVLVCFGSAAAFDGLSDLQVKLHKRVLRLYAEQGRAPGLAALGDAVEASRPQVVAGLAELSKRDLVVLDQGELVGAYPFTNRDTGISVRCGGDPVYAMCAVDALGTGAMLDCESEVRGSCAHCERSIVVQTSHAGANLRKVDPAGSLVWVGIKKDGPAATSLCAVIRFVCGREHLDVWLRSLDPMRGHALALPDALAVGRAIFGNMLEEPSVKPDHGTRDSTK